MLAVVVTFQIRPDDMAAFMPAMLENAASSLAQEEGCHQFDVCTDPDRAGGVFLYELYKDRAAFDMHLASPHFKSFDAHVSSMIVAKTVTTYAKVVS